MNWRDIQTEEELMNLPVGHDGYGNKFFAEQLQCWAFDLLFSAIRRAKHEILTITAGMFDANSCPHCQSNNVNFVSSQKARHGLGINNVEHGGPYLYRCNTCRKYFGVHRNLLTQNTKGE